MTSPHGIAQNYPWVELKLRRFAAGINKQKLPVQNKYILNMTSGTLVRGKNT